VDRKRRVNARIYRDLFAKLDLEEIELPFEGDGRHIYNQFVIKISNKRDDLKNFLSDHGIGSEIYYPVPLHIQECFKHLNYKPGDCPVSVDAAAKTLALPIYSELTFEQIEHVVNTIHSFYRG